MQSLPSWPNDLTYQLLVGFFYIVSHFILKKYNLFLSRGGEIRTPINGFGDHYTSPCTTPLILKKESSTFTGNVCSPLFFIYRFGDIWQRVLVYNLSDLTCSYRTTTFTDCETESDIYRYWVDKLYGNGNVVSWHNHLNACW